MKHTLDSYREQRDQFLSDIVDVLLKDERIAAGWLRGSLSRDEADFLSDIDLSFVISDAYSPVLCVRRDQVSAQTSSERYAFFSQFGVPALIHENNNNAPEGGTFTFVLYRESAVMVDWVLIPQSKAKRPHESKLLFDKVGIPFSVPAEPEDPEQKRKSVAEMWAFFWMMTAVTIKYIRREDGVFAVEWIEHLHALIREIERKIDGRPPTFTRDSISQLPSTREKQLESVRGLCTKMQDMQPKVAEFTGAELLTPSAEIELLFSLVKS